MARLHDAHLHLQDPRLKNDVENILHEASLVGVRSMVVNGTSPEDWNLVAEICAQESEIKLIPSFGLHPWKTPWLDDSWKDQLIRLLDANPHAGIGECGLDRWMDSPDIEAQEDAFRFQLEIAAERNLPISIHVLKAWGWLLEILNDSPIPERGFLLHSYGGSIETAKQLEKLGGYFSFSGYFLNNRKSAVQQCFRNIARDRILIETDAPDMLPPASHITHPFESNVNHPANLASINDGLAEILGTKKEALSTQLEQNFQRFFVEK